MGNTQFKIIRKQISNSNIWRINEAYSFSCLKDYQEMKCSFTNFNFVVRDLVEVLLRGAIGLQGFVLHNYYKVELRIIYCTFA